jgi:hypothetical protein
LEDNGRFEGTRRVGAMAPPILGKFSNVMYTLFDCIAKFGELGRWVFRRSRLQVDVAEPKDEIEVPDEQEIFEDAVVEPFEVDEPILPVDADLPGNDVIPPVRLRYALYGAHQAPREFNEMMRERGYVPNYEAVNVAEAAEEGIHRGKYYAVAKGWQIGSMIVGQKQQST